MATSTLNQSKVPESRILEVLLDSSLRIDQGRFLEAFSPVVQQMLSDGYSLYKTEGIVTPSKGDRVFTEKLSTMLTALEMQDRLDAIPESRIVGMVRTLNNRGYSWLGSFWGVISNWMVPTTSPVAVPFTSSWFKTGSAGTSGATPTPSLVSNATTKPSAFTPSWFKNTPSKTTVPPGAGNDMYEWILQSIKAGTIVARSAAEAKAQRDQLKRLQKELQAGDLSPELAQLYNIRRDEQPSYLMPFLVGTAILGIGMYVLSRRKGR